MFDLPDDIQLELELREGLRAIPTPETSRDFDARVLSALAVRQPWWRAAWTGLRPLLSGAIYSMAATFIVLRLAAATPTTQAISINSPAMARAVPADADALADAAARRRERVRAAFSSVRPVAADSRTAPMPSEAPERRSQLPGQRIT